MNSFLVRIVALSDPGPVGPWIAPSFCYIAQLESHVKVKVQTVTRSPRHGGSFFAIERIHFFDLDPGHAFNSSSRQQALFAIIITGFPQDRTLRKSPFCSRYWPIDVFSAPIEHFREETLWEIFWKSLIFFLTMIIDVLYSIVGLY
jgi:hypothetical protein